MVSKFAARLACGNGWLACENAGWMSGIEGWGSVARIGIYVIVVGIKLRYTLDE